MRRGATLEPVAKLIHRRSATFPDARRSRHRIGCRHETHRNELPLLPAGGERIPRTLRAPCAPSSPSVAARCVLPNAVRLSDTGSLGARQPQPQRGEIRQPRAKPWEKGPTRPSPERAKPDTGWSGQELFRPFRAGFAVESKPRALPWAGEAWPCRPQATRLDLWVRARVLHRFSEDAPPRVRPHGERGYWAGSRSASLRVSRPVRRGDAAVPPCRLNASLDTPPSPGLRPTPSSRVAGIAAPTTPHPC